MSHYLHHVPGRLRIRNRAFRCSPEKTYGLSKELAGLPGVDAVRCNERNGSLTIQYQPSSDAGERALQLLADAGCLTGSAAGAGAFGDVAGTFGKAVIAAVAQQTVVRSFSSLAAVLR